MVRGAERWTRLSGCVEVEAPRKTYRFDWLLVSPGGLFVETDASLDPQTPVSVRFSVDGREVVARAEVRRQLDPDTARARGLEVAGPGWELRLVRMEGDGAGVLAEHIKKTLMATGGPG